MFEGWEWMKRLLADGSTTYRMWQKVTRWSGRALHVAVLLHPPSRSSLPPEINLVITISEVHIHIPHHYLNNDHSRLLVVVGVVAKTCFTTTLSSSSH